MAASAGGVLVGRQRDGAKAPPSPLHPDDTWVHDEECTLKSLIAKGLEFACWFVAF